MQSKHPLRSKTIIGLVIAALPILLSLIGLDITAGEQAETAAALTSLFGIGLAVYGRWKADKPLSVAPTVTLNGSNTRSGFVVAALLTPLLLLASGCATTAADQGTSSGWTDTQGMNVTVNFYADSGQSTDAEIVEGGDPGVPAGRIVLDNSTINLTVTIGSDGQAEATRGDASSTNTPTVDTELSGIPGG